MIICETTHFREPITFQTFKCNIMCHISSLCFYVNIMSAWLHYGIHYYCAYAHFGKAHFHADRHDLNWCFWNLTLCLHFSTTPYAPARETEKQTGFTQTFTQFHRSLSADAKASERFVCDEWSDWLVHLPSPQRTAVTETEKCSGNWKNLLFSLKTWDPIAARAFV